MNEDQTKLLAATVEVLGQAVRLLMCEKVMTFPADRHEELLRILQKALSTPPTIEQSLTSPVFISHEPLGKWMPVAAAQLIDGVRAQLAEFPEARTSPERPTPVLRVIGQA